MCAVELTSAGNTDINHWACIVVGKPWVDWKCRSGKWKEKQKRRGERCKRTCYGKR